MIKNQLDYIFGMIKNQFDYIFGMIKNQFGDIFDRKWFQLPDVSMEIKNIDPSQSYFKINSIQLYVYIYYWGYWTYWGYWDYWGYFWYFVDLVNKIQTRGINLCIKNYCS